MTEETKRTNQRSPNYPFYSLKDCVQFIERLKSQDGFAAVPRQMALQHMGFDPSMNKAFRAASAMTGFGLLEEKGPTDKRVFVITDIGRTIVVIKDDIDKKINALQNAALRYDIIKDLKDFWSNGLPSDDVLKLELLERGFTERTSGQFKSVFRETYEYARLGERDILQDEGISKGIIDQGHIEKKIREKLITPTENIFEGFDGYTLTLAKGKEVRLYTSSNLTKDDIDFMFQWLKRLDLIKTNDPVHSSREEAGDHETKEND